MTEMCPKSTKIAITVCAVIFAATSLATAQQPVMYEVQINGETFRVEGNRQSVVTSTSDPKVKYHLAVRVDPVQLLRLNKVQLEYESPASIEDDKGTDVRFAHVNHKDGYSLGVIDLGQKFDKDQQTEAIGVLTKSTTDRVTAKKYTNIEIGKIANAKFGANTGPWRIIHFKDAAQKPGTCMLFVLTGDTFTVSCVGEYLEEQANDAKPWIGNAVKSLSPAK